VTKEEGGKVRGEMGEDVFPEFVRSVDDIVVGTKRCFVFVPRKAGVRAEGLEKEIKICLR